MKINPYEKLVEWGYASYGPAIIEKRSIKLIVRDIWIDKGVPGCETDQRFAEVYVTFENVQSSIRNVFQQDEQTVIIDIEPEDDVHIDRLGEDMFFVAKGVFNKNTLLLDPHAKELYLWELSGNTFDPDGWVEWKIYASSMRIVEKS